jgi:hypothetical protein
MSAKSLNIAAELKNELEQRGYSVVQSFDTDNEPLLTIGGSTAGQENALIKLKTLAPLGGSPSIGFSGLDAASAYCPVVAQLVLESSSVAGSQELNAIDMLKIVASLAKRGMDIELYLTSDGDNIGADEITGAQLTGTWYASLKWKQMSSS